MITDTTLNEWKAWLQYASTSDSVVNVLPIQLRDSEDDKSYPGIYLEEVGAERIESGGVMDGNSWRVEIETKLVTTPGDDTQMATSAAAHDVLRRALGVHVESDSAGGWIDSRFGIVCHQLLTGQPMTTEANGYRVTTWRSEFVVIAN